MDFEQLALSRHSVRVFEPREISGQLVTRLLEAARWAPSAGNLQPWHFFVVRDEAMREAVCASTPRQSWLLQAPVLIVAAADPRRSAQRYLERGQSLYCIQDTAAAIQNILLCTRACGLGACWVGAFDEAVCAQALDLADGLRPVAILPVGYPAQEPIARERRPLSDIVTYL